MKERFIRAYNWCYGSTRKEASGIYQQMKDDPEFIRLITQSFEGNAKRSFYTD